MQHSLKVLFLYSLKRNLRKLEYAVWICFWKGEFLIAGNLIESINFNLATTLNSLLSIPIIVTDDDATFCVLVFVIVDK